MLRSARGHGRSSRGSIFPSQSAIAIHGQTVHHAPPVSWQLVNPWPVAQALACTVVTDLRGGDLALGGQGAPITPLADWVLLRDEATAISRERGPLKQAVRAAFFAGLSAERVARAARRDGRHANDADARTRHRCQLTSCARG